VGQNPTIGPDATFFSGPWIGSAPGQTVQSQNLEYLGLPSPGGSVDGGGSLGARSARALASPWNDATDGTYYIGFLVNFGTTAGSLDNNMGYRAVEFWGDPFGNDSVRTDIGYNQFYSTLGLSQRNAATAQMQFNVSGAPQQIVPDAPAAYNDDGLTHLIVVKFALSSLPLSDTVSMYLDPFTTVEPLPSAIVTGINFRLYSIGTVANFGGGTGGSSFDELRVTTTFHGALTDGVVPEPAGLGMALVGALLLMRVRRGG
jgi:hypothetical protein